MNVGIIGGGQLARMLALAGYPLGLRFKVYDPSADACAGQVAPLTLGDFDDVSALQAFAEGLDVVTFDFENVPAHSLRALADRVRVAPGPEVLEVAQDRIAEKTCARELAIPCGDWWPIDSAPALMTHLHNHPGEYVLKTRRLGYDGKGQVRIGAGCPLDAAFALAGTHPCILEALVPFDRELSIIGVRGEDGELRCYPLIENFHADGILRTSTAPAVRSEDLQSKAERHLAAVAARFNYVGILTLELFQVGESLFFNEMAPRVHNSGHWTIEGSICSQFQNHLRAICGWPLGGTRALFQCEMKNFIGENPDPRDVLGGAGVCFHHYGKSERRGRKVGHVNRLASIAVPN
jgi:5-(carboxyamino)imidazole ribonucleotide synthase